MFSYSIEFKLNKLLNFSFLKNKSIKLNLTYFSNVEIKCRKYAKDIFAEQLNEKFAMLDIYTTLGVYLTNLQIFTRIV